MLRCARAARGTCKIKIAVPFTAIWNHDLLGKHLRPFEWYVVLGSPAGEPEVDFEVMCRPCALLAAPDTIEFLDKGTTPVEGVPIPPKEPKPPSGG